MIGDRQKHARFQSDFYRDSYYKMLNALIYSCVVILFLIMGIIYLVVTHPSPNFYATTLGGQIIPMKATR